MDHGGKVDDARVHRGGRDDRGGVRGVYQFHLGDRW